MVHRVFEIKIQETRYTLSGTGTLAGTGKKTGLRIKTLTVDKLPVSSKD